MASDLARREAPSTPVRARIATLGCDSSQRVVSAVVEWQALLRLGIRIDREKGGSGSRARHFHILLRDTEDRKHAD